MELGTCRKGAMNMWRNDDKWIENFLENYQLKLEFYEDYGKIKKVYTSNGVFAIKTIDAKTGFDFIRNVQMLYQSGYNRIVPVFPTVDGRYGVLHNDKLSYIMPWLPDEISGERTERHQQMFRELARMHTLSAREETIPKEEREEHYEKTVKTWEEQNDFLAEFLKTAERKWYMSPFEQLYCICSYDISQALSYSMTKFKAWYETTKDDEKVRNVITHGNVSIHHYLYSDNGYGHFINFEKTKTAPPYFDLLPFVVKQLKTYPVQSEETVDWIYLYLKYFPFKPGEMLLFQSYIAHPGNCIKILEQYSRKKGSQTEVQYCRKLQRQYWLLKNIEYIIMRMEQIEESKKQNQQT